MLNIFNTGNAVAIYEYQQVQNGCEVHLGYYKKCTYNEGILENIISLLFMADFASVITSWKIAYKMT